MTVTPPHPAAEENEPALKSTAGRSAGRNVIQMLTATVVTAATGVALAFWVPAMLSVDDFGYWRSFLLYAGYAGFLHLGMVDGALLDWTRPSVPRRGASLGHALLALTLQQLAIAALGLLLYLAPVSSHPHFREILVALFVYALLFNLTGLIQSHLQSRLKFSSVALATAAPGLVFLVSLAVLRLQPVTLDRLLVAYLIAWSMTLALLLAISLRDTRKETRSTDVHDRPLSASLRHIGIGWPIMLANTSYGLMQSADRITVNLSRSIHDFAIYSLAQSSIYVPVAVIAAVTRVAFSHFAIVTETGRQQAYRDTVRLLTLAWMLLLPYYFAVEWAVARWLPRYTAGLPAGKVLLLSVLFLSLISVVQANAAALAGRQRRFFAGSIAAVLLAFATARLCAKGIGHIGGGWSGSLTAVAWSQVLSAALWWLGNEWAARKNAPGRQPGLPPGEIVTVALAFAAAAAGLYVASIGSAPAPVRAVLYYGLEVIPIYLLFRDQLGETMRMLRSALSRAMEPR